MSVMSNGDFQIQPSINAILPSEPKATMHTASMMAIFFLFLGRTLNVVFGTMTSSSPLSSLAPGVNPIENQEEDSHSSLPKTRTPAEVSPVFNKEADQEGYPLVNQEKEPPTDRVDYRSQGGPLLSYLRCDNEPLSGQSLYQGAELGSDNRIYFVPGHAARVMVCDPESDKVEQIGPSFDGKHKWLRAVGVKKDEIIYGIPCNSESILSI